MAPLATAVTTPAIITAALAMIDEQAEQTEDVSHALTELHQQVAQVQAAVATVKPPHAGTMADLVAARLLPDVHVLTDRLGRLEARVADINASVSLVCRQVGRMRRSGRR